MNSPKVQSELNRKKYADLQPPRVGICRVLHDKECMVPRAKGSVVYPFLSRNYSTNATVRGIPESVRINGGKSTVLLAPQWRLFEQDHAGIGIADPVTAADDARNLAAFNYISRKQSGWVNYGPWPTIEQLTWGGAFVVVTRIDGHKCYIETYSNALQPTDYKVDYLQRFTTVYSDDRVAGEPLVYTFLIANKLDGPLWMYDYDLTFYRSL